MATTQITYKYAQPSNYVSPLSYQGVIAQTQLAENTQNKEEYYIDPSIVLRDTAFEKNETYYFKFTVKSLRAKDYIVDILLMGEGLPSKLLKKVIIPGKANNGNNEDFNSDYTVELIFSPLDSGYNEIRLSLEKSITDIFKNDINEINNLINKDNIGEYAYIEPLDNNQSIQGRLRLEAAQNQENLLQLNYKGLLQQFKLNQSPNGILLSYGENSLEIPYNTNEVMTIEEDELPSMTDWSYQNTLKFYIGEWLPVYYYKINNNNITMDKNIRLEKVENIVQDNSNKIISKIGLQAKPYTLFTLDGEEFRVGENSCYQLEYPDLKISKIGIVPPINENLALDDNEIIKENFFILDYRYTQSN